MRRSFVVILVAALAMWAADASYGQAGYSLRTPGAQALELNNGYGRAAISRLGSLFVTVRLGRIRVVDLPGGGRPNLSAPCQRRARRVSRTTLEIRGRSLGCRIWTGTRGGPWQVVILGRRINASGLVRGSLTLDAYNSGPTGTYRIAGGPARAWPRAARTITLLRR